MEQEDKEKNKEPILFVGQDYTLPFCPVELNHSFSVIYKIEKEEKTQILEQNFDLIRLTPDTKQNDYHFIEIRKMSPLLINGEQINTRAYKVAEQTAELLYPLRIVVNKFGKWKDLNSYDKLEERWEKQKDGIKELFDGKTFLLLAKNIENAITDRQKLVKLISGNWFLRAYFNGIHRAYTQKLEREMELHFPAVAGSGDTIFSITQKASPYLNSQNLIEVTQSGEAINEGSDKNYEAKYHLNPDNYLVEYLHLECDLTDMGEKITVEVKNITEKP